MGKLSTHVLDVTQGKPGVGVRLALYLIQDGQKMLLKQAVTNRDGRCDGPLLQDEEFQVGRYELVFGAGDYFASQGIAMTQPRFIDDVVIGFGIADAAQNYHVPLVVSPWSYSTYRGS